MDLVRRPQGGHGEEDERECECSHDGFSLGKTWRTVRDSPGWRSSVSSVRPSVGCARTTRWLPGWSSTGAARGVKKLLPPSIVISAHGSATNRTCAGSGGGGAGSAGATGSGAAVAEGTSGASAEAFATWGSGGETMAAAGAPLDAFSLR